MMVTETLIAPKKVVNLYEVTNVTPLAGIEDYTEGIYNGNSAISYEDAQKAQHNYLLNEISAGKDFRLLEIGCGLGTLLETARERGVNGTGITISKTQVARCKEKGLDVYLLNYKNLLEEWNMNFDGIIANGSLEHFCQPEDAIAGRQDQIYKRMFEIFARLLNPNSPQKVATTSIHFKGDPIEPKKLPKNPFIQLFDREGFHAAVLYRGYGGYYPAYGQLEKCAKGTFEIINEVDGTEDYRITSKHWTREYNKALFTNTKMMRELLKHFLKRPVHTFWVASSYIGFQSWAWQFRGENSRTRLLRQTWRKNKTGEK